MQYVTSYFPNSGSLIICRHCFHEWMLLEMALPMSDSQMLLKGVAYSVWQNLSNKMTCNNRHLNVLQKWCSYFIMTVSYLKTNGIDCYQISNKPLVANQNPVLMNKSSSFNVEFIQFLKFEFLLKSLGFHSSVKPAVCAAKLPETGACALILHTQPSNLTT